MKLVRIAKGRWEVLAVVDHRGRCQVLDFLDQLGATYEAAKTAMLGLLQDRLPRSGPPKENSDLCKPLGSGLFELRKQPKGRKLRVIFFYDDGFRIVCTNAFTKAEKTPQEELASARLRREQYLEAKFRRELQILEEI
jgi:phage-related protein